MTGNDDTPRAVTEIMRSMVGPTSMTIKGDRDRFTVTIGGMTLEVCAGRPHAFEQLAAAIESRIAYERAMAMVAAAGETGVPLWLVTGSEVLGKWLAWSRTDKAFAQILTLTDQAGAAPIAGKLARRARRDLGQMSAKIRVLAGQAVAERIELSHRVPAIAVLGERATIRIARHHLPEVLLLKLFKDSTSNDRWRASEIIDHPFFAAHDLMVADVRNDGSDVVVELKTSWQTLAPVPKAAWSVVPRSADPAVPWRATHREVAELYALAARGDRLIRE